MELLSSQWSVAESDLQEGLLRNGSIENSRGEKDSFDDGKSRDKIKKPRPASKGKEILL